VGFFENVLLASPDPIFGLNAAFKADPREKKINLSVGVYKTEDLKTPILNCVKKAEAELLTAEKTKEYLPIEGYHDYLDKLGELVFGKTFWAQSKTRIAHEQTIGGTSALRVGGDLLKQEKIADTLYLPDPTWPNHRAVFANLGMHIESYPYYDGKKHQLNFEGMCAALNRLPPRTVVLLHACCHNPTGADLSLEEWEKLSTIIRSKRLIPFFDLAYQGFGRSLEEDVEAVRLFAKEGHEMLLAVSLSKNFSLYAERVGALFVTCESHKIAEHVLSKMKIISRRSFSNPPLHGAGIVATILNSTALRNEWEKELSLMRGRIDTMRKTFSAELMRKAKKTDFSFLQERRGLFCFTGLTEAQVNRLIKEFGIYMPSDGRINVAGLNSENLDYVVDAIIAVLK
jgi:aspartate/tyrosine/aromatic aminotransferase